MVDFFLVDFLVLVFFLVGLFDPALVVDRFLAVGVDVAFVLVVAVVAVVAVDGFPSVPALVIASAAALAAASRASMRALCAAASSGVAGRQEHSLDWIKLPLVTSTVFGAP